jgi:hypothetical protein
LSRAQAANPKSAANVRNKKKATIINRRFLRARSPAASALRPRIPSAVP